MSESSTIPGDTLRERAPVTLDESGLRIGDRYRLVRPLGRGAAGVVYAAIDERVGGDVAIKLVRGSGRNDATSLARLRREATAAGRIGHPNIVRVTDAGTDHEGLPFVVMERLSGETLADRLEVRGPLSWAEAREVFLQLADAAAAAHAAGVLHRDIKPGNVFLATLASGRLLVKLLDFGLAALYEDEGAPRLTAKGLLVGSLVYTAPERLLGGEATERSDVYAIGVTMFEALTGTVPFHATNSALLRGQIVRGEHASLDRIAAAQGEALAAIVTDALSRDPAARIGSARELRDRLVALDALEGAPARDTLTEAQASEGAGRDTLTESATTRTSAAPGEANAPPDPPAPEPDEPAPAQVSAATSIAPSRSPRLAPLALTIALVFVAALGLALALRGSGSTAGHAGPHAAPPAPAPVRAIATDPSAIDTRAPEAPLAPTPAASPAPAPTAETSATPTRPPEPVRQGRGHAHAAPGAETSSPAATDERDADGVATEADPRATDPGAGTGVDPARFDRLLDWH